MHMLHLGQHSQTHATFRTTQQSTCNIKDNTTKHMLHLGQHNKAHVAFRTTQQSTCNIYDSSFLSEHSYTAIFSFVKVDFSCLHEYPFIDR